MKIVRAWPDHPPAGRAHVVDDLPRVTVDRYDYSTLLSLKDDVISLDWDIAPHPEDLDEFARRCRNAPLWPRVAPYRLYHRRGEWSVFDAQWQPLPRSAPACAHFGFGMVYLPRDLLAKCEAQRPRREVGGSPLTDAEFSGWFWKAYHRLTPVDWDLRPVHLHV